jgi:hypothetical protein
MEMIPQWEIATTNVFFETWIEFFSIWCNQNKSDGKAFEPNQRVHHVIKAPKIAVNPQMNTMR